MQTLKLKLGTSQYRNVMDMNAVYGGFAANLMANNDPVWVMNVVPVPGPNTLGTIYDRGLLGVFHDWQVLTSLFCFLIRSRMEFMFIACNTG